MFITILTERMVGKQRESVFKLLFDKRFWRLIGITFREWKSLRTDRSVWNPFVQHQYLFIYKFEDGLLCTICD